MSGDIDALEEALDLIFQALADERRRAILRLVAEKPRTVTELGRHVDASTAGVSKHVRSLRAARLVAVAREGRFHWCRLDQEGLELAVTTLRDLRRRARGTVDPLDAFFGRHAAPLPPARRTRRRP